MFIHKVSSSDELLNSLSNSCFDELRQVYYPTELARKRKTKSSEQWVSFGYYIGDDLVGCVEVNVSDSVLNLRSLAVAKEYRGHGVARNLISSVIGKYQSVKLVSVWCVEQTGNVQVFERLGFKVAQRLESDLFELVDGSKVVEVQLECGVTA